jgi:hypothetical protein
MLLAKATEAGEDQFEAFSEWTFDADETVYCGIRIAGYVPGMNIKPGHARCEQPAAPIPPKPRRRR